MTSPKPNTHVPKKATKTPIGQTETINLSKSINDLTHIFKKRTSLGYRFLSGIVTGVGTVIGATVLAGIVIYLLSTIVHKLNLTEIPVIQELIEQSDLSSLEKYNDEKD